MIWICLMLIQQRREPPMATRRAPVTLPLWSKNLCRTAWRQGQARWGWANQTSQLPPNHLHLCLVVQSCI